MVKSRLKAENLLREKISSVENEYQSLTEFLSDPKNVSDPRYRERVKEVGELSAVIHDTRRYQELSEKLSELEGLKEDEAIQLLVEEEELLLKKERDTIVRRLREHFFSSPEDRKNALVEIRAGTGGEEASLFAQDLFRMYGKFAERRRWKLELLHLHTTGLGGIKEVIFLVHGVNAYLWLKHERGVHRVQRVPRTESSGRLHTSAATVAVFPEAEEHEVVIDPGDLKIDTFCSAGAGGQSVNTTYSAVRITHLPSGIVVSCQDERSQAQNKLRAMKILRARLSQQIQRQHQEKVSSDRKNQIKSGDRSEKIRTYNFPQNRVTDHRLNITLHTLDTVMEGNLDALWESSNEGDLYG